MKREIKFRAWDKENKEMVANVAVRNSHFIYAQQTSGNDAWDITYIEDNNFEIMQFIGRKDKNEKEIYEGDILEGLGHIVYLENESRFAIDVQGSFIEICLPELEQDELHVIGNIYEHPKLIDCPMLLEAK